MFSLAYLFPRGASHQPTKRNFISSAVVGALYWIMVQTIPIKSLLIYLKKVIIKCKLDNICTPYSRFRRTPVLCILFGGIHLFASSTHDTVLSGLRATCRKTKPPRTQIFFNGWPHGRKLYVQISFPLSKRAQREVRSLLLSFFKC